jgi:hypothetical protein
VILRRVAELTTADNVRLDEKLWNVEEVMDLGDGGLGYIEVHLSRRVGDKLVLLLRPDDLILLAI